MASHAWTLPFGANVYRDDRGQRATEFRVWAPRARLVELELVRDGRIEYEQLHPQDGGIFWIERTDCPAGTRYKYRIDGRAAFPDPWSRRQPDGVHGPSEVIDPTDYNWTDGGWSGLEPDGLAIYEVHVGTYTRAGTFEALRQELSAIQELGVTAIQIMPVAAFPGRRGWGYDGVSLFAPFAPYGTVNELKRLIDDAHDQGLGVLLDVVYNHLGPDGNYLGVYSDRYFTDRYRTPWGDAPNFERTDGPGMRQLVIENACYWLHEFRFDGLRLDATHAIYDDSDPHLLTELADRARAVAGRPVVILAENENNEPALIDARRAGGAGLDAVLADDFHHQMRVYLTGERHGYYQDFTGELAGVGRTIAEGFFYQGQESAYLRRPRGYPVRDQPAMSFIFCLENHDQVGNRALGERLGHLIDPDLYLIASLILLTAPETPLIFMGQEFAASAPFLYFTDHVPELGEQVTAGRRSEFAAFPAFADPARRAEIPDPQAESTFRRSVLDLGERRQNQGVLSLYQDLLQLRRDDPVLRTAGRARLAYRTIGPDTLMIHRWHGPDHRLILANFGDPLTFEPVAEARAIAGPTTNWRILLQTRDSQYQAAGESIELLDPGPNPLIGVPARTGIIFAGRSGAAT